MLELLWTCVKGAVEGFVKLFLACLLVSPFLTLGIVVLLLHIR